jgi:hypothetical protein
MTRRMKKSFSLVPVLLKIKKKLFFERKKAPSRMEHQLFGNKLKWCIIHAMLRENKEKTNNFSFTTDKWDRSVDALVVRVGKLSCVCVWLSLYTYLVKTNVAAFVRKRRMNKRFHFICLSRHVWEREREKSNCSVCYMHNYIVAQHVPMIMKNWKSYDHCCCC